MLNAAGKSYKLKDKKLEKRCTKFRAFISGRKVRFIQRYKKEALILTLSADSSNCISFAVTHISQSNDAIIEVTISE